MKPRVFDGFMVASLATFLAVAGAASVSIGGPPDGLHEFLLVATALWGVAYLGVRWGSVSRAEGAVDPLEVPVFWSAFTVVGYAFFGLGYHFEVYRIPVLDGPRSLLLGTLIPLLGLVGLWVGYGAGHRVLDPRAQTWWTDLRSTVGGRVTLREPGLLEVLLVLAIIWWVRLFRLGGPSSLLGLDPTAFGQIITVVSRAALVPLAVLAIQAFRGIWPRWPLAVAVAGEVVYPLVLGFVKPVLWLILVLYATHLYAGDQSPATRRRRWTIAGAAAILFILLLPVLRAARTVTGSGFSGLWDAVLVTWGSGNVPFVDVLRDRIVVRQSSVAQSWAAMVETTPSHVPHWGWAPIVLFPILLVPRAIWPGKPDINYGEYFRVMYTGRPPGTSTAYTVYGGLYLHGGWFAVFLGSAFLGVVAAALYRFLLVEPRRRLPLTSVAFYVAVAAWAMDVESGYLGMVVGTTHNIVVFGAVSAVLFLRPRRGWTDAVRPLTEYIPDNLAGNTRRWIEGKGPNEREEDTP